MDFDDSIHPNLRYLLNKTCLKYKKIPQILNRIDMSDLIEVAFTSDVSGASWTCCAWDVKAGTNLMSYRGGAAASAHTIAFIRDDFLVAANTSKPLLHIWPVNSQEQVGGARFVTPGRVTALDVTPDGNFVIAGVAESVYVWQLCSGKLLAVLARHYQTITSIKCTSDGSHFVSAGQDGMVLVWNLGTVVGGDKNQQPTPLYSFSDHALPVSDIFIGAGEMRSYLVSVSLDRTCKVYDLSSGNLLLNIVFADALTAITVDHLETKVYVGSINGAIYEFSLQAPPRQKEYHLTSEDTNNRFAGHTGAVTCLSTSLDGENLLSGGHDSNVLLWHIPSKQLIRTMAHKGSITNTFFRLAPAVMFDQDTKLSMISGNLKRMIDGEDSEDYVVEVLIKQTIELDDQSGLREPLWNNFFKSANNLETFIPADKDVSHKNGPGPNDANSMSELENLRAEVKKLKRVNKELYQYSVKCALKKK